MDDIMQYFCDWCFRVDGSIAKQQKRTKKLHLLYISLNFPPVFSVIWSLRNHSSMLIRCSRNFYFYYHQWQKQLCCCIYFLNCLETPNMWYRLIQLNYSCWDKHIYIYIYSILSWRFLLDSGIWQSDMFTDQSQKWPDTSLLPVVGTHAWHIAYVGGLNLSLTHVIFSVLS